MGIDLSGKVAIVTGGARGIGKGMATALIKAGAAVTITDINELQLKKTGDDLRAFGRCLDIVADGRNDDAVNDAVQRTAREFGRIDVVINNAQTSVTATPLEEHSMDDLMSGIDSGLFASFRYMKAAFPYLKESQGTVVNFASQAGLIGNAGMVSYNIAKEGIRALTRTAAREWGKHNITVNTIIPGVLTEGGKEFFDANPEHYKYSLSQIPMGRMGHAENDLGALAVFLASGGAHYITGETISCDGGRVLRA